MLRYNEVLDITSELLDEVYVDVTKEPILQEVNNEDLLQEANKSKEACLNISAFNFWTTSQQALFDVKVFNLLLKDIVRWKLRKASEEIRATRKETKTIKCCKLKMSPLLPWSLLQIVVWEKNAFDFTEDWQR